MMHNRINIITLMRSRNVIENTKYIMQYTLEIFALRELFKTDCEIAI